MEHLAFPRTESNPSSLSNNRVINEHSLWRRVASDPNLAHTREQLSLAMSPTPSLPSPELDSTIQSEPQLHDESSSVVIVLSVFLGALILIILLWFLCCRGNGGSPPREGKGRGKRKAARRRRPRRGSREGREAGEEPSVSRQENIPMPWEQGQDTGPDFGYGGGMNTPVSASMDHVTEPARGYMYDRTGYWGQGVDVDVQGEPSDWAWSGGQEDEGSVGIPVPRRAVTSLPLPNFNHQGPHHEGSHGQQGGYEQPSYETNSSSPSSSSSSSNSSGLGSRT